MAKAGRDNNRFILLKDARDLLAKAWQSVNVAENLIRDAWAREQIRSRAERALGRWRRKVPPPTLVDVRRAAKTVRISWEESSATLIGENGRVTFHLIEMRREDLERLLPSERPAAEDEPQISASEEGVPTSSNASVQESMRGTSSPSSKEWILSAARANSQTLKKLKDRTAASTWLEQEMIKAKRRQECKKALDRRTIEGYLRQHNLP